MRQAHLAFPKSLGLVVLLVQLLSFQPIAYADGSHDDAVQVVRGLADRIWSSREAQAQSGDRTERLAQAIEDNTSVELLSRLVLGRHWRSLNEADQAEYRGLFADVVIRGLARRLGVVLNELNGSLDQHFIISESLNAGKKDVLVRTKVMPPDGQPLSVDWRLRQLEGGPAIIDLIVEGVSLLVSQRAEFASIIERSRIEGLLDSLRRQARNG